MQMNLHVARLSVYHVQLSCERCDVRHSLYVLFVTSYHKIKQLLRASKRIQTGRSTYPKHMHTCKERRQEQQHGAATLAVST